MPPVLHWFKYEAYFTWITGFALLCSLYYMNAGIYMIDRQVADLAPFTAVSIGIGSLLFSWFFYDGLCRSAMKDSSLLTGLIMFGWFAGLAWILTSFLSGRAAYIHVGAAIGTIMVANVFTVIIPARKDMVAAMRGHSFDWKRAWNVDAMVFRTGIGQLAEMEPPMGDKSEATA